MLFIHSENSTNAALNCEFYSVDTARLGRNAFGNLYSFLCAAIERLLTNACRKFGMINVHLAFMWCNLMIDESNKDCFCNQFHFHNQLLF